MRCTSPPALPGLAWQPTDVDADALRSIAAHRRSARLPNLLPALELDAAAPPWPVARADAVVAINMIHIAPWTAAEGLMAGAARVLAPAGVLYLYGPFKENGRHTAPSNAAFDASLRASDPEWGVRDLAEVAALAATHGLGFRRAHRDAGQQSEPCVPIPWNLRLAGSGTNVPAHLPRSQFLPRTTLRAACGSTNGAPPAERADRARHPEHPFEHRVGDGFARRAVAVDAAAIEHHDAAGRTAPPG